MSKTTAVLLMIATWLMIAAYAFSAETNPVFERERQSMMAGLVMGIDVAWAYDGLPKMTKETFVRLADVFQKATRDCVDITCVGERVKRIRDIMYLQNKKPSTDLEVIR
jgi:hypothetical protein